MSVRDWWMIFSLSQAHDKSASVRPELVEGQAGFDGLSPNGVVNDVAIPAIAAGKNYNTMTTDG